MQSDNRNFLAEITTAPEEAQPPRVVETHTPQIMQFPQGPSSSRMLHHLPENSSKEPDQATPLQRDHTSPLFMQREKPAPEKNDLPHHIGRNLDFKL